MTDEEDNTRCVDCGAPVDGETGDCTVNAREHHGAPGGICQCHPRKEPEARPRAWDYKIIAKAYLMVEECTDAGRECERLMRESEDFSVALEQARYLRAYEPGELRRRVRGLGQ